MWLIEFFHYLIAIWPFGFDQLLQHLDWCRKCFIEQTADVFLRTKALSDWNVGLLINE
jgi:hypothetical protein